MYYNFLRFISPIIWMVVCSAFALLTLVTAHSQIVTPAVESLRFDQDGQLLLGFAAYLPILAALVLSVGSYYSSHHGSVLCDEDEYRWRLTMHVLSFVVSYFCSWGGANLVLFYLKY